MAADYSQKEFEQMKQKAIESAREMQKRAINNWGQPHDLHLPFSQEDSYSDETTRPQNSGENRQQNQNQNQNQNFSGQAQNNSRQNPFQRTQNNFPQQSFNRHQQQNFQRQYYVRQQNNQRQNNPQQINNSQQMNNTQQQNILRQTRPQNNPQQNNPHQQNSPQQQTQPQYNPQQMNNNNPQQHNMVFGQSGGGPQTGQTTNSFNTQSFPQSLFRTPFQEPQTHGKEESHTSNNNRTQEPRKQNNEDFPAPDKIFRRKNQGFNPLFSLFGGGGGLSAEFDDDKLLIIGLVLLLCSEKTTDPMLVLALLYILM